MMAISRGKASFRLICAVQINLMVGDDTITVRSNHFESSTFA